jgi:hypothetical protein
MDSILIVLDSAGVATPSTVQPALNPEDRQAVMHTVTVNLFDVQQLAERQEFESPGAVGRAGNNNGGS